MRNHTRQVLGDSGNILPDGARVNLKKLASISGCDNSIFSLFFVSGQEKGEAINQLLCERRDLRTGKTKQVSPSKKLIETALKLYSLPEGVAETLKKVVAKNDGGKQSSNPYLTKENDIFAKLEKTGEVYHAENGVVVYIADAANAKQQRAKKGKGGRKPESSVRCYDPGKKGPLSKKEIPCGLHNSIEALQKAQENLSDKRHLILIKKALRIRHYQIQMG